MPTSIQSRRLNQAKEALRRLADYKPKSRRELFVDEENDQHLKEVWENRFLNRCVDWGFVSKEGEKSSCRYTLKDPKDPRYQRLAHALLTDEKMLFRFIFDTRFMPRWDSHDAAKEEEEKVAEVVEEEESDESDEEEVVAQEEVQEYAAEEPDATALLSLVATRLVQVLEVLVNIKEANEANHKTLMERLGKLEKRLDLI